MASKFALLLSAALLSALTSAPVLAQSADPQPERAFGQKMPQQFLFNRLFSGGDEPEAATVAGETPAAATEQATGQNGQPGARQAAQEEPNPNGPFPRQYLLNRMFSAGNFKDD